MKRVCVAALMLLIFTSTNAIAQSSTLSGTVSDPTGALIPGVTVIAINDETGVLYSTLTNDTGTYTSQTFSLASTEPRPN